jgi:hypothetical protein
VKYMFAPFQAAREPCRFIGTVNSEAADPRLIQALAACLSLIWPGLTLRRNAETLGLAFAFTGRRRLRV